MRPEILGLKGGKHYQRKKAKAEQEMQAARQRATA